MLQVCLINCLYSQYASPAALQALGHGMVTARSLLVCSLAYSLSLVQLPSTKVSMFFGCVEHHSFCGALGFFCVICLCT